MKKRLQIFNLNEYERPNPQDLIRQAKDYITNDTDNSYFYKVESLYLGSPTTQSIIDKYTSFIMGEGIRTDLPNFENILSRRDLKQFILDYKIQGNALFDVVYNYKGEIAKLYHLPTRCFAANKEEDIYDDPTSYWFCPDWKLKYMYRPYSIPAFGYTDKDQKKIREIAYLKRPSPQPIYSLPDWQSGVQYSELEMELSNFFLKHTKNSFSVGTIINVQGVEDTEEAMDEAERKMKQNLTGTNGERIVVSFNDNAENKTTVETIDIPDAYQKFEFVSREAREKIMMSLRVNDTGLFGIPASTGFSSDSEKILQSKRDLYRDIINPTREEIIDFLNELFPENTFEFIDFEEFNEELPNEDKELNVEMSCEGGCGSRLKDNKIHTDEDIDIFIEEYGEDIDLDDWELISDDQFEEEIGSKIEMEVGDDIYDHIKSELNLVSTGKAIPNASSEMDVKTYDTTYKVRYRYDGEKPGQRKFCQKMLAANKLYRKEDLERMEFANPGFGINGGAKYSVLLYKGGPNCKHFFTREIYKIKDGGNISDSNRVSRSKAEKESNLKMPFDDPRIAQKPYDMPNRGYYN